MQARDLGAVLLALTFHGALLVVASRTESHNLLFARAGLGDAIELEIDEFAFVGPRASEPAAPPEAPSSEAAAPSSEAPGARAALAEDAAKAPAAGGAAAQAVGEPALASTPNGGEAQAGDIGLPALGGPAEYGGPPAPGSPGEYGGPPTAGGPSFFGLGSSLWSLPGGLDLGSGPAAPTRAPSKVALDGTIPSSIVASTLRDHDKDLGLAMPSQGVVTSVVSTATRNVPVPHNTRATFEVRLGPGGKVLSSRVLKHSGGEAAQWETAAKAVAASLAGRTLDLGSASLTGATVIVNVTTKHVFPAGTTKAADIKPVCANQLINDLADSLDEHPADAKPPAVPLFTDENGRPCIPVGIGGVADLANLGAKKQVVVQASSEVLVNGARALPARVDPVNTDPIWVNNPQKAGPRPVMPFKMRKYQRDKEKKR